MSVLELFRRLMGLPTGATAMSDRVDRLDLVVSAATAIVAATLLAVAIVLVRRGLRRRGPTPRLSASKRTELGIAGSVTVVFLAFWIVGFAQYAEMTSTPAGAEVIHVEGKQWTWKFTYGDGRVTNDVLTVPAGRPIRLVMSSRDVIHSFFVPAFRLKQDLVPGRTTSLSFEAARPGRYPIWCAEYCGASHSAMLGTVEVLTATEYEVWRAGPPGELAARGREIAHRRGCVACHSLDGAVGTGPSFQHLYGSERRLVDGRHVLADDAYLTRAMALPNADVVLGYPAIMPTYQGLLEPAETGALLELLRSLQ